MADGSSEIENTFVMESPASFADGFEPGQIVVGKYKIVSLLGRGGIGSVYKVDQVFLGQSFALKTLNSQKASDQLIRRFQNEARAASSLSHPNLVKVIDFGLLEGQQPYLVMDLVEGLTLSEYLKQNGPLSLEQAVGCFTQVCLGLSYAHDQGIIHRDIKPSNVMIFSNLPFGADGFVKVVDFGIAKIAYAEDGEVQSLTTTGEVFGSPLYMSPEQCSGLSVDHRTDIYSLGCVLFEVLTGTSPFVGQNALSTMMLHQQEPAPTLKEASLGKDFPPELEQIVGKLLEKSPADRYQNLGVVANDLAQLSKGAPVLGVKSDKKHSKNVDAPVKMSRRNLQLWLTLTALGAGLIGGGVGYCLAKMQLEKSDLKTGSSAVVKPSKSSNKDTTSKEYRQFSPSAVSSIEDGVMSNLVDKAWKDEISKKFEGNYNAARDTVDKAKPDDRANNQKGLDQFLALQKEAATKPKLERQFGSSIEERISVCKMRLGRISEAEEHLRKAVALASSDQQNLQVAFTSQSLAERALQGKRYEDAFNNYLTAASICEKLFASPDCKPDFNQVARRVAANSYACCCTLSYQSAARYQRAIEMGEKAKKLLEPLNDKYAMGCLLNTLGVAYSRANQLLASANCLSSSEKYLAAPSLAREAPLYRANALYELAAVEAKSGDHKKALECCKSSLKALARYKPITDQERKFAGGLHDQFLAQIKIYERAVTTASVAAGASAGSTPSSTTGASTGSSK